MQIKRIKKFNNKHNQKKSALIRNLNKEVELLRRKLTTQAQEIEDLKTKRKEFRISHYLGDDKSLDHLAKLNTQQIQEVSSKLQKIIREKGSFQAIMNGKECSYEKDKIKTLEIVGLILIRLRRGFKYGTFVNLVWLFKELHSKNYN